MSAETLPTDRLIGETLANRYQILHRLGEGAMGAVYKARHVKVGRSFAVKVLHTRVLEDPKLVQRFEREAELAGRLRHANVVGVVDVGEIDGMRYMVMDFAEGPDLAQLLNEAPMPPARIIHLVRQMLEGLYHAHEQGMIHRDFKPENVIVERDSHGAELPRIVDFGIAILRDGGAGVDQQGRLTTNGLVLGTPHYMAPEQAVADPIDHRIDLFALGIVVYEMLSGRLPYDGSGAEVARANLLLDPPPIAQRVPYLEVDPLLEAFARRLMAKKRNDRPVTAKAARVLLDLIERDRMAAAAALGLPPAMSLRAPAVTMPVSPHDPDGSSGTFGSPPVAPSSDSATASMRSPGVASPVARDAPLEPAPFSVARAAVDPRAPIEPRDFETSRRTPLGWQAAPVARRRTPWLVGGAALGVAGVVVAATLARTTETPEPASDRIVMTPTASDPAVKPSEPSSSPPARPPAAGEAVASPSAAGSGAARPGEDLAPPSAARPVAGKPGQDLAAVPVPGSSAEGARPGDPPADRAAAPASAAAGGSSPPAASDRGAGDAAAASGRTRDGRDTNPRGRKGAETSRGNASATAASGARPARATALDTKTAGGTRSEETAAGRKAAITAGGTGTTASAAVAPRTLDASPPDPKAGDAEAGEAKPGGSRTGDPKPGETKAGDAKAGEAKARTGEVKAADARTGEVKAADARAGETKTGTTLDPKAAAKPLRSTGLTANELSNLYASVGRELSALPSASAQDLWSRLLLIKIQELMAAPQARRDEAGRQLVLIHQEAVLRKP